MIKLAIAGQPHILKQYNKNLILHLIFDNKSISKPELAQLSKLSLPTVNKIVDELIEERSVIEGDFQANNRVGRRAKTYSFNAVLGTIIILYFIESSWQGAIIDLNGNILHNKIFSKEFLIKKNTINSIFTIIDHLYEHTNNVNAIGIGIPGVVLSSHEITAVPSLPDLEGINIEHVLAQKYSIPVLVENDVKLMTVGYHSKNMPNISNMAYLYAGDGLGAGLIISNQLYKGYSSFAGEFGYMPSSVDLLYETKDITTGGSLENYLSSLGKSTTKPEKEKRSLYVNELSRAIVSISTVVNPEAVVIYSNKLNEQDINRIIEITEGFLPTESVPGIYLTTDDKCGPEGLINLCLQKIRPWNKLHELFDTSARDEYIV